MLDRMRRRTFTAAAIAALCWIGVLPRPAIARAAEPPATGPIVVQNEYYPKPGLEDQVYQLRLRASAVRARLGLVEGRVLRRSDGPDGGPLVLWQAEYPSLAAREDDVARLDKSAEFKAIQEQMATLVARFERSIWQVAPGAQH